MIYTPILISILEVLVVTIPVLLTVAFVTVAERKTMASMQRRLGPNVIGYYGLLQPFADALKLLLKEYVSPTQSNLILFFLGPIITLIFSLLGYSVIPYGPGMSILDFDLGVLYILAVSSLSTYGILLAGWSANSKYAFLGSLRSTAQLISYELILSSAILLVILLSGSLSLTTNIESQKAVWYIVPLLPVFIIFFIGCIAETNRAPFDLAEAESELVSGFMTEHAAVVFVFFFLAEYASIVLICVLTSILFLGGYLFSYSGLLNIIEYTYVSLYNTYLADDYTKLEGIRSQAHLTMQNPIVESEVQVLMDSFNRQGPIYSNKLYNEIDINKSYSVDESIRLNNSVIRPNDILKSISVVEHSTGKSKPDTNTQILYYDIINGAIFEGCLYSLILGLKSCAMIFVFIWARASFPRIRYDQLMSFCWTILLPLIIALIILLPCVLNVFSIFISSSSMLCLTVNAGYNTESLNTHNSQKRAADNTEVVNRNNEGNIENTFDNTELDNNNKKKQKIL